ncbi:MAG: hypothetical protein GY698_23325 [Actinomycetia bacterium]|nr:hypothetical protein [Actinomycetes bacterium]
MQPAQIRLVEYPGGIPGDETWEISHDPTPDLCEGQVEVEAQLITWSTTMVGFTIIDYLNRPRSRR